MKELCQTAIEDAVYQAVLYSHIFDYPLTRHEIFTFLPFPSRSRDEVNSAIDQVVFRGDVESDGDYLFLPGRSEVVSRRKRRLKLAARKWESAVFYARLIWAIPFVRMVAVTGALAVDNVEVDDDTDFLVVTAPGRLWLTRAMIVLLGKFAGRHGQTLCPNYLVTTEALSFQSCDLYTARELVQMVPLHGEQVAAQLWEENEWSNDFLPNADGYYRQSVSDDLPWTMRMVKSVGQGILSWAAFDSLEEWERQRKTVKLTAEDPASGEAVYGQDVCKGHSNGHGRRVMSLFTELLREEQAA